MHIDERIGWPNVSRETIDWPTRVTSESMPSAPPAAQPDLRLRPPGPRRAHFDEDEFSSPALEPATDVHVKQAASSASPRRPNHGSSSWRTRKVGSETTTVVNLSAALALGGLSVLVVDLDPQGNAGTALGIDHTAGTPGTYEVLLSGAAMADHVVESPEAPNLKVLPATIDLAGAEIALVSVVARENRLSRALTAYLSDHPTDYVFLDCPPSLGLLTLNALVAASEILIPIQCEYYALEGVSQLMRTINLVKGELNDRLRLTTVLLTMYDARTRLAAQGPTRCVLTSQRKRCRQSFPARCASPRHRVTGKPSSPITPIQPARCPTWRPPANCRPRRKGEVMTTTTERRGLGRGLG